MNKTITRLNRVIGQINGIIKMMDAGEDCSKVIVQFQASKAALESAFALALEENLASCIETKKPEDIKKILKLISKN